MEQCIKCNKEFKTKDLFLQWVTTGEGYVCKNCIKKYKQYTTDSCYAEDSDITFVFAIARISLDNGDFVELSQTLMGYHYGKPDNNHDHVKTMLEYWLRGGQTRKDLLRQSFNENGKYKKEVLY